jgi:hypothetical protein
MLFEAVTWSIVGEENPIPRAQTGDEPSAPAYWIVA